MTAGHRSVRLSRTWLRRPAGVALHTHSHTWPHSTHARTHTHKQSTMIWHASTARSWQARKLGIVLAQRAELAEAEECLRGAQRVAEEDAAAAARADEDARVAVDIEDAEAEANAIRSTRLAARCGDGEIEALFESGAVA